MYASCFYSLHENFSRFPRYKSVECIHFSRRNYFRSCNFNGFNEPTQLLFQPFNLKLYYASKILSHQNTKYWFYLVISVLIFCIFLSTNIIFFGAKDLNWMKIIIKTRTPSNWYKLNLFYSTNASICIQ